jgi:acyl carrier protein
MNHMLSDKELQTIDDILIEQLGVNREQIAPDAEIMRDLGADSLDMAEIAMLVEDRFALTISDVEFEKVVTVADLREALSTLLHRVESR